MDLDVIVHSKIEIKDMALHLKENHTKNVHNLQVVNSKTII